MSDGMTEARKFDDVHAMPDKQDLRLRLSDVALRMIGVEVLREPCELVMQAVRKLDER